MSGQRPICLVHREKVHCKKLLSVLTGAQLSLPNLTLVVSQADLYPVHPVNPHSGLSISGSPGERRFKPLDAETNPPRPPRWPQPDRAFLPIEEPVPKISK